MFNNVKSSKGFSLFELVIVVVIIGIILLVAIPHLNTNGTKIKITKSNQKIILSTLDNYYDDVGHYPLNQQEFETFLQNHKYFAKLPLNPFYSDNTSHPEKGWVWDPQTQTVTPVVSSGSS